MTVRIVCLLPIPTSPAHRRSRMFGVESRQLLKTDDPFEPVREINEQYRTQAEEVESDLL